MQNIFFRQSLSAVPNLLLYFSFYFGKLPYTAQEACEGLVGDFGKFTVTGPGDFTFIFAKVK